MPSRNSVIAQQTVERDPGKKPIFSLSPPNYVNPISARLGVRTKGPDCGAVFVLFYYDITLGRVVVVVVLSPPSGLVI